MGRPVKSTALKKMQGTYQKVRDKDKADGFERLMGVPDAPSELHRVDGANELWDEIVRMQHERGVLFVADLPHIAQYCIELSMYFACVLDIQKSGYSYHTPQGQEVVRPVVKQLEQHRKASMDLARKLNIIPESRLTDKTDKNPFSEFTDD